MRLINATVCGHCSGSHYSAGTDRYRENPSAKPE
jgi:hypothetical protein